jgi:hypothetical protein
MALENEQLRRLEQATLQQNSNIGRFNSSVASLLQQSNKNVEKTVNVNAGTGNTLSKYFQTSLKIQTEQTNILRQIAEILSVSNKSKKGSREDFLRSASKQGMEFDISKETPRKGFFRNMWTQSAKVSIDKKIKDSNRKLAKSMGLSMSLTSALTTPASSKFRGIVAENELDFSIVQTNILMGMYELQRFSLMQLVDINKSTSKDKSSSVTEQQRRLEKNKTSNYTSDFDSNEDPRTFMQKVGNVPLVGGLMQATLAPIKELLTIPSLPNRLKKWWGDYKESAGLQKKDKTEALKATNLYRSNQDRAYDFLGGEFITIVERIRADVAAVRYNITGEKPGTDPKTGISLTKSREDVYDTIFGKFIEAQRDEKGNITQTASQKKFQIEELRKKKLDQYYQEEMQGTFSGMFVSTITSVLPKIIKDKLGIEEQEQMVQGSLKAMNNLNEAEYENAEWLRRQNEVLPTLIESQDMFSTLLGVGIPALAGLATVLTGGGAALGAGAAILGVKGTLLAGAATSGGVIGALRGFIDSFSNANTQFEIERLEAAKSQADFLDILKDQKDFESINKRKEDLEKKFRGVETPGFSSPTQTTNNLLTDIKQQLIDGITIRSYVADANGVPINLQYLADFFKNNYVEFTQRQQEILIRQDSIIPEPVYLVDGPAGNLLKKHAKGGIAKQGIVGENERPELMGRAIIKSPTAFSSLTSQKITSEDDTADILQNLSSTIEKLSGILETFHKDKVIELQDKKEVSIIEQIKIEADDAKARDEAEDRDIQIKESKEIKENISQLLGVVSPWYKMEKKNDEEEKKKNKKGFFSTLFSFLGSPLKLLPLIGGVLASIGGVAKTVGALTGTTSTLLKLGLVLAPVVKGIASGVVSLLNYFGLHPIVELGKKAVKGTGTLFGKIKDLFTKKGTGTVVGDVAGAAAKGAASEAAGTVAKGAAGTVAKGVQRNAAKAALEELAAKQAAKGVAEKVVGEAASSTLGTGLFKNKSLAKFLPKVGLKSIAKVAGPLLIVDGLIEMFSDYQDTGSIIESVFGNMKGGLSDAFKGMGKYGAMGATIGLVGGPIGMGIGALIGSAIGGLLGLFGTDNLKSMDAFKARTGEFNQTISQFFIDHFGKFAARGAYFFADSPIPIIPPILGGLIGSVVDGIVGIFSLIGDIGQNIGPFITSANTSIAEFFSSAGKYGSRISAFFSDGIPIIGPLLGGLVGTMIDGAVSLFDFGIDIAKATGPLLDSVNGSIIGFFKDYSGEYSVKLATSASSWRFPGITLLGGLVGTAVDGIAALIGSISNFKMDDFVTKTMNMSDSLVDLFKGEYSHKFAEKGAGIAAFIGPLLGGIGGMVFDFINSVFFDGNLDEQFKLISAEISYFFSDLWIKFRKKIFFTPLLGELLPDDWKAALEKEEEALKTKKQEIEQLKQAVKDATMPMEIPARSIPESPKASELPDTTMPAGTPSAPPTQQTIDPQSTGGGVQGAAVGAWNAAKSGAGAAWNAAKGAASTAGGWATSAASAAGMTGGSAKDVIKKILTIGKGFNIVQTADGSTVKREGNRNWRNNNPGNIEFGSFTRGLGALAGDPRFAIFPSLAAGRKAKEHLLFEGKNYRNVTLTQAIHKWAPPSENDTGWYQRSMLAAVGGVDKKMSEYTSAERTALMNTMQKVEGFKPGKLTILSKGNIPVNNSETSEESSSFMDKTKDILNKTKQMASKFNPMGTAQASTETPNLPTSSGGFGGVGPLKDLENPQTTTPIGTPTGATTNTTPVAPSETEIKEPTETGVMGLPIDLSNKHKSVGGLKFAPGVDPGIGDGIASKVKTIQDTFGQQLIITSGYRSPERNKRVGGAKNSAHMRRNAVDIKTGHLNKDDRLKIIKIASQAGVGGVGIYSNDLHFDVEGRRAWGPSFSRDSIPAWAREAAAAHMANKTSVGDNGAWDKVKGMANKAKDAAVGAYQTVKGAASGMFGGGSDSQSNTGSAEQPVEGEQGEGNKKGFTLPSKEEIAAKLKSGVSEFGSMMGSFFGDMKEATSLSDSDKMSKQILYGDANASSYKSTDLSKFGVTPMKNQSLADFTVTNTGLRDAYASINSHQPISDGFALSSRFKNFIDQISPFNKGVNINSPTLRDQSILAKKVTDQVSQQTGEEKPNTDQSTNIPVVNSKQTSNAPPVINMPSNINNINQTKQSAEDNFDKKFDADTDKFIWQLLSAVPDLLKKDTYLFGTGIDFGTATNQ